MSHTITSSHDHYAQKLVEATHPASRRTRANRLFAVRGFLQWADRLGYPMDTESLFTPDMVTFYLGSLKDSYSANSVANFRSILELVGRTNTTRAPWVPKRRPTKINKPLPIYTPEQIEEFRQCADMQTTVNAKRVLYSVLTFGHGAGVTTAELLKISYTRLGCLTGHPLVRVEDRTVPIHKEYFNTLEWLLSHTPQDEPFIGVSNSTHDKFSKLLHRCQLLPRHPSIRVSTLRHTWMVSLLRSGIPLADVIAVSGLTSLSTVERLVPHLETSGDVQALYEVIATA